MKKCLIILLLFIYKPFAYASHIMGGEITWECTGGAYVFTLKVYRDCRGTIFPFTAQTITVHGHPTLDSILVFPFAMTELSPAGCGVNCTNSDSVGFGTAEEYVFRSLPINLGSSIPPPGGWIFSWTTCCRNVTISNLPNPGSLNITIRSKMYASNSQSATPCFDNSPVFAESAVLYACTGVQHNFSMTASDADADSLSYEFAYPAVDAPDSLIQYSGGYTLNNPLPGNSVLDPTTGHFTVNPLISGDYCMCIKVSSYKCGILMAEVYRDIQIGLTINCGSIMGGNMNHAPVFEDTSGAITFINDTVYAGDSINIFFQVVDFDLSSNLTVQLVKLDAHGLQFGDNDTSATSGCLNPPCAVLNIPTPNYFTWGAQLQFNWRTGCAHASMCNNTLHQFVFSATDDHCPVRGKTHFLLNILVKGPDWMVTGNTIYTQFPNGPFQWLFNSDSIPGAVDSFYVMTATGAYSFQVQLADGCIMESQPYNYFVTGGEEFYHSSEFTLSPNPAHKTVRISFHNPLRKNAHLKISDLPGRTIYNYEVKDNPAIMDVSFFEKGLYIISVEGSEKGKLLLVQ